MSKIKIGNINAENVIIGNATIIHKNKPLEWINEQIDEIMINFGPDGHTDGSNIITEFIAAILTGQEDEFIAQLQKDIEIKQKQWEKYKKRNQ